MDRKTFTALLASGPRRIVRSTSVGTRLAIVAVSVALASLIVTGTVGLRAGSTLAEEVVENRQVAVGASRADQIERYVSGLRRQVSALALSPATASTIRELAPALAVLDAQDSGDADLDDQESGADDAVIDYYRSVVVPELEDVRGRPVAAPSLVPAGAGTLALQRSYTVSDRFPSGEDQQLVDDAGDESTWTEIHERIHPIYRDIAARAGFEDLYLIDSRADVIVYSVAKNIDLATSLDGGPHSGSALAELVDAVELARSGDEGPGSADPIATRALVADFSPYGPRGDRPTMFVAAGVVSGGSLVGVVAAAVGPDRLSSLMTDGGDWDGFGDSGETYLAAQDARMRSDPRPFVEDRSAHLSDLADDGLVEADALAAMERFDTAVSFHPVNGEVVRKALNEGAGVDDTTNYLGTMVRSSYRPLEIEGLEWVVVAEFARSELGAPLAFYARDLLIAFTVIIVALTFGVVRWANRLVAPLRIVAARLRQAQRDETLDPAESLPAGSPRELVVLAADVDRMLERLDQRRDEMARRSDERVRLLRALLPRSVSARAEAGERDVLDVAPSASVVVGVLGGLGAAVRADADADVRDLIDRIVEEADGLARTHGVTRSKLSGDSYQAVCGVSPPRLDHATRTVLFALELVELVDEIAHEVGHELSMSVGVASGPVTVGLTGGARLVYESWGPTVSTAATLARGGGPSEVIVAASTRAQLPGSFRTVDLDPVAGVVGAARASGVDAEERTP